MTPNTGEALSSAAAQSPAHAPNSKAVSRYISQVVSANSRTKGSRTKIGLSPPPIWAPAQAIHQAKGGWSK